jgi:hypothetical protein
LRVLETTLLVEPCVCVLGEGAREAQPTSVCCVSAGGGGAALLGEASTCTTEGNKLSIWLAGDVQIRPNRCGGGGVRRVGVV